MALCTCDIIQLTVWGFHCVCSSEQELVAMGTSTHPFPINLPNSKQRGQLQPTEIELVGVFLTQPINRGLGLPLLKLPVLRLLRLLLG
jgi:hypothetical protein